MRSLHAGIPTSERMNILNQEMAGGFQYWESRRLNSRPLVVQILVDGWSGKIVGEWLPWRPKYFILSGASGFPAP